MATEGNLEAPTRHPLDWKNPDFYNEEKCFHELERIFRHLPWLPALCQPVRLVSHAV